MNRLFHRVARLFSTQEGQAAIKSISAPKTPLNVLLAYFSYGLNFTLVLGLYQLGQDANDASKKLEQELQSIRQDTAATQQGLRAKISKLESELGLAKKALEEKIQ